MRLLFLVALLAVVCAAGATSVTLRSWSAMGKLLGEMLDSSNAMLKFNEQADALLKLNDQINAVAAQDIEFTQRLQELVRDWDKTKHVPYIDEVPLDTEGLVKWAAQHSGNQDFTRCVPEPTTDASCFETQIAFIEWVVNFSNKGMSRAIQIYDEIAVAERITQDMLAKTPILGVAPRVIELIEQNHKAIKAFYEGKGGANAYCDGDTVSADVHTDDENVQAETPTNGETHGDDTRDHGGRLNLAGFTPYGVDTTTYDVPTCDNENTASEWCFFAKKN